MSDLQIDIHLAKPSCPHTWRNTTIVLQTRGRAGENSPAGHAQPASLPHTSWREPSPLRTLTFDAQAPQIIRKSSSRPQIIYCWDLYLYPYPSLHPPNAVPMPVCRAQLVISKSRHVPSKRAAVDVMSRQQCIRTYLNLPMYASRRYLGTW